jgi:hypothetical protein
LLTFFGKTKKVSGPAAVERIVAQGKHTSRQRATLNAKSLDSRLRGSDTLGRVAASAATTRRATSMTAAGRRAHRPIPLSNPLNSLALPQ